jgi:hypothetical protein
MAKLAGNLWQRNAVGFTVDLWGFISLPMNRLQASLDHFEA